MKRKRRPPPRVLLHLRPCPDCAATWEGTNLVHEPTCPLANAVDDACDEDRRYFIEHPGEPHYTREITAAELSTMQHLDPAGAATGPSHVHVLRIPGGRMRQFCNHVEYAAMAIDPDPDTEVAS